MPIRHTVSSGDCISSIAFARGFFPDTVWNHADNADLKSEREDPNVLRPGDVVVIPDKTKKQVDKADKAKHRFKRKGVPDKLRLQILTENGDPVANRPYVLDLDGALFNGSTDGDGVIERAVPPDAKRAKLTLENWPLEYNLNLGHLAPADTLEGAQMRLNNLGYDCESTGGRLDEPTAKALRRFQGEKELDVTGELDQATIDKLKEVHGC